MGTFLQEVGHDAVIVACINKVLKEYRCQFFVVTAALGPKRDIFMQEDGGEYRSVYASSRKNYIPEFYYRIKIPEKELKKLDRESDYATQNWYKKISEIIGKDARAFLTETALEIENRLNGNLPDVIGFGEGGRIAVIAEIKFEGLSKKAVKSVEHEHLIAKSKGCDYCLVIPKRPVYGSEVTDSWLLKTLPKPMRIFKFSTAKGTLIPRQKDLVFDEVK